MKCNFSVIVPIYNVDNYLDKCLNSILNQSYRNYELILINDGSIDGSIDICNKYKKIDSRIKIINIKSNLGPGEARNKGLKKASGDYIIFVDSDDYIEEDTFLKINNKLLEKDVDILLFNYKIIYLNGKIEEMIISKDLQEKTLLNSKEKVFNNYSVWSKVYKKSFLDSNNILFPKGLFEDVYFTILCMVNATSFSFLDDILYNYCRRVNSIMSSTNYDIKLDVIGAYQKTAKYLKDNKLYSIYKEEYEYGAICFIVLHWMYKILLAKISFKKKKDILDKMQNYVKNNIDKKNIYLKKREVKARIIYSLFMKRRYYLLYILIKVYHLGKD